jgi:hypothetical protein
MEIPLIAGVRDETLLENPYHFRVGENEPTARNSVVSSATKWMAVHNPQENRFTFPRS